MYISQLYVCYNLCQHKVVLTAILSLILKYLKKTYRHFLAANVNIKGHENTTLWLKLNHLFSWTYTFSSWFVLNLAEIVTDDRSFLS